VYPLLFGSYSSYLPVLLVMAVIPVTYIIVALRREGVAAGPVIWTLLSLVVVALLGAKVFSLATRGWPQQLWSLSELNGGLRFSGGIIGVVIVMPLLKRLFLPTVTLARTADVIAVAMVLVVCFGRVACLLTGCCTGAIGQGLLYFSYPPGSTVWYRHLHNGVIENSQQWSDPVLALPVLFFFASLLAAMFLLRFDRHRQYDGQLFLLFLLLHELPKSLLELLRVPLLPEQLTATLVAGTVGLLALVYFYFYPPAAEPAPSAVNVS